VPFDPSTPTVVFRCWRCATVQAILADFEGQIERHCRRCRAFAIWSGDPERDLALAQHHTVIGRGWAPGRERALSCYGCNTLLAMLHIVAGTVTIICKRCKWQTSSSAARERDEPTALLPDDFMTMMEDRWDAFVKAYNQRRSAVAVGLRFDVFNRDGFRCRYCGACAADGAILHADHVVPRKDGGPTTLANLVTACFDCNSGKSAKALAGEFRPI